MKEKVYVLDASGIIGGFISSKNKNFTSSDVVSEIKDLKSQIALQSALDHGKIIIEEPDSSALNQNLYYLREVFCDLSSFLFYNNGAAHSFHDV